MSFKPLHLHFGEEDLPIPSQDDHDLVLSGRRFWPRGDTGENVVGGGRMRFSFFSENTNLKLEKEKTDHFGNLCNITTIKALKNGEPLLKSSRTGTSVISVGRHGEVTMKSALRHQEKFHLLKVSSPREVGVKRSPPYFFVLKENKIQLPRNLRGRVCVIVCTSSQNGALSFEKGYCWKRIC